MAVNTTDRARNPLFLVGPSRSGKTQLLCAIENAMKTNVMRTPASMFAERLVDAIRRDELEEFRSEIRKLDALLLDDLDLLSGRPHTLEEVAHTFKMLAAAGVTVVATSSTPEVVGSVTAVLRSKI